MSEFSWMVIIVSLVIWELSWKAMALWRAARLSESGLLIATLFLFSFGIIPIIYLIVSTDHSDGFDGAGYKDIMTF